MNSSAASFEGGEPQKKVVSEASKNQHSDTTEVSLKVIHARAGVFFSK